MGYSVLPFCVGLEVLESIKLSLEKSNYDFSVIDIECPEVPNLSDTISQYPVDAIILDLDIGHKRITDIIFSLSQIHLVKRIPIILAVKQDLNLDLDFISKADFDDFIEYPIYNSDNLASRIILAIHRRSAINSLIEKSEQFKDISLAASKAGSSLIIIDKNGEIVWVNEGFEHLYECNLDEFTQKFGKNVFKSQLNGHTVEAMTRCAEQGENVVYESIWFTNDNKRKNIQTSLTPIFDLTGKISKIIAIETDITDIKMAEEALNDKHDNLLSAMEHLEAANQLLDDQRHEIELQKISLEEEKNKSDALLLNILPEVAAHQLKKKGFVKPKKYNEVSVLFADFVNFSSLSVAYETIEEFLAALSYFFETFDEITTKRFIEKIKTIGDCYMCVGGVPQGNKSHPFDTVLAALEMQKFVEDKARIDQANGKPVWRIRVGIHSGSVMAGVIGKKKFAYDVWGDTVNVASRMESKGEAGKVNVSETTYNAIQNFFKCTYRGKVLAKNIGEINMYFVERILPDYSDDEEGYTPNALFRKELAKY
jgi:PAS domain S-box-containing protein